MACGDVGANELGARLRCFRASAEASSASLCEELIIRDRFVFGSSRHHWSFALFSISLRGIVHKSLGSDRLEMKPYRSTEQQNRGYDRFLLSRKRALVPVVDGILENSFYKETEIHHRDIRM